MSEDHLTEDYADIRDAVAKLCAQFPGEYWRKLDREMAYPKAFVDALTEAGYLSVLIPEEYGGAGLKLSAAAAILEEIQRAGCNGGGCHAQMYTMGTVLRHGNDEQKAKYLPKIASGELRLQAFGVTEPTSGTDTSSLKTFARKDGNDSYIVNGQKIWTSRAEHSDLMILLARTTPKEQAKKRTDGLSVFIVDMREAKNNGLEIRPIRTMMNHATTEVFFTDMKVPAENLIGEEGKGFRYILSGMNAERILIAAECVGDAKWFIAKATNYAKERSVFGRPIGQNQGIQFPIAKAYASMRAAELMVKEATRKYEAGLDCGAEANMAKMLAADASWEAANACIQTHGGFGFAEEYDVERKFRETRLYQVAPISTNLVLSFVAEHVLGDEGKHEVGRDRRHLVEPRLAELALDVVFLGKAEAAMGLDAGIGRFPGRIRRQHLGHVGLGAAVEPGLVFARGLLHHQLGRAHRGVGLGDRELDALILADRPAENAALLGVVGRLGDEPFGVADAFRRDQDALGIHPGEDVAKALAFLADQILGGHLHVGEEHFGGGVVHHGADRADLETVVLRLAHVDDEHRQAVRALLGLLLRSRARQQDHQVGMLGAAGPDLLAVDDIAVVAVLARERLQRGGVGAAGRLGDAEGLQPQFAARDLRQILGLLLVVAVTKHGAHRVHLGMAAAAVAARALDLLQDRRRSGQLQAGAAIFLGDQHREIAGLGQRIHERLGISHLAIELAPILAGKLRAELGDGVADVGVIFGEVIFTHGVSRW